MIAVRHSSIGQVSQATRRVTTPTRMGSLIGNRHGSPFPQNSTRAGQAGSQPSEAIAKIIDISTQMEDHVKAFKAY